MNWTRRLLLLWLGLLVAGSAWAGRKERPEPSEAEVGQQAKELAAQNVGYTAPQLLALWRVARLQQVNIRMRPTNKEAVRLRAEGIPPKPAWLKMKTGKPVDLLIGAPEGSVGYVLFFQPHYPDPKLKEKDPKLRAAMKKANVTEKQLLDRFGQRAKEYTDNLRAIRVLVKGDPKARPPVEPKILDPAETGGIVTDRATRQPFTGDQDAYSIGGPEGGKRSDEQKTRVLAALKSAGLDIEHGAHKDWEIDDIKDPKERAKAQEIDTRIRDGHRARTAEGTAGEKLIQANPWGLSLVHDRSPRASP